MAQVSFEIACLICIFPSNWGRHEGALTPKKTGYFWVFSALVVLFSRILDSSVCNLYYICKKWLELSVKF